MHLLCTFATTDFVGWKAGFDDAQQSRDMAGLTLLQMWQDADSDARVTCLFMVTDRKRAEDWILRARSMDGLGTAQFLKTTL